MRILILSYEFPPLGGGAGNATAELVKALASKPCLDVVVVTSSPGKTEVEAGSFTLNSTIYRLDVGKRKGNIHYQTNVELLNYTRACRVMLKRLCHSDSFDCCHAVMTLPAGLVAWLLQDCMPYVVSLQGSDVPGYSDRYSRLYPFLRPVIRRIWRDAKAVVSNSSELRDLALQSAPDQRIEVIPNGVDTDLFAPGRPERERNGKLRLICVGRLIERKGIWELLEAFRIVREKVTNVQLDLVGTGILEDRVKAWIRQHGLSDEVTVYGAIDHDSLPEYMRRSELFVLPSHAEGMSNALAEGMACGLPVVVTQTGGTKELVSGNGVVVPKKDPRVLAEGIMAVLSDGKRRMEMARASREIACRYSWESMAERYLALYG